MKNRASMLVSVMPFIFLHCNPALAADTAPKAPASDGYASAVPADQLTADSVDASQGFLPIAQPVDEIVDQHMAGRGGYAKLKNIGAVTFVGTHFVGCEQSKLNTNLTRKGAASSETTDGLDAEQAQAIRATFDFDGPLIDWHKKRYTIQRLGMEKLSGILAWKLEVSRPDGYRQVLYLNSHKGDIVRESIENARGQVVLDIWRHDFRDVVGTRFPFAVDYKNAKGDVLASDRLQRVEAKSSLTAD